MVILVLCVFNTTLSVSHARQPSIGVTGTQESPCIELLLCHYMHAHTHTHTRQTHPCWNKHNPPAPLSWVTLPKQNNNDRQQGGDVCLCGCVCPLVKHTHTHTDTQTLLNPLPGDLQLFGWRVEVRNGSEETSVVCGEGRAAQANMYQGAIFWIQKSSCGSAHWLQLITLFRIWLWFLLLLIMQNTCCWPHSSDALTSHIYW